MKRRFTKAVGFAAVLVLSLAFFTACPGGDPVVIEPPPPPEIWILDDFNHGFASPLNGFGSSPTDPYWGDDRAGVDGLGYWFGGVSLGGYLFLHIDAPHATAGSLHLNRVSAYYTPHPENSWGRVFQNITGETESRPVPAGATGISFWVFEEGTDDGRDEELLEVAGTWLFMAICVDGIVAETSFTIEAIGVRQQVFLDFPPDFGDAVYEYMFFMQPEGPYEPEEAPPEGTVSGAVHFTQMRFVNPDE